MSDGLFLCIEFTMTGQLIDLASVGVTTHKRNEMCYIQIAKRSVSQIFCLSSLYRKTALFPFWERLHIYSIFILKDYKGLMHVILSRNANIHMYR